MTELRGGMRVVVLGLGRSGEAAARALLDHGARVAVLDEVDAEPQRERADRIGGGEIVLGRNDPRDLAGADLVVASPGVPFTNPWIVHAQVEGIPVWSEVELAFRIGVEPVVGVTGTNGKTTTVEMIAAALSASGTPAIAMGNIGLPLVDAAGAGARIVAEISSFQLAGIERFRVPVAALLNLDKDHLDWHGTVESYQRAKARIFENQVAGDVAIHHDDDVCRRAAVAARAQHVPFDETVLPDGGAGVEDGWIVVPRGRVVAVDRLRVRGRPGRANAVAAAAAACALGADPPAVGEALAAYEPKPHRMEWVGEIGGVAYVNDSKASDPHATLAALEELDHVILIAGGRNKGLDLGELTQAAAKVRVVVAIGESSKEIGEAFTAAGVRVEPARTIEEAVTYARALARPGDTVLLSPACASWDMFTDYAARGEAFRAAVRAIEEEDA